MSGVAGGRRPLRVGIVGFDHPHVLRYGPLIASTEGVELAWIAEDGANAANARAMAGHLSVPFLAEPRDDVDAAYVAARPTLHRSIAERLAAQGVHLLLDKPIALTADDGQAIVEAADAAGIVLMVPFNPRGQLGLQAVKERVDRGELGDLRLVHAVKYGKAPLGFAGLDGAWLLDPPEAGFGGFGDIGMHAVDALRWVLGGAPRSVHARIHSGVRPDLPLDTIGTATFEWDSGAIATVTAGWANPPGYPIGLDATFEIVGTAGAARVDHPYQELRLADDQRLERVAVARTDVAWNLAGFLDAVRRGVEPPISGEDGLRALELVLACYRSSSTGAVVRV